MSAFRAIAVNFVLVVAVTAALVWLLRRARRVASREIRESAEEKERVRWSKLLAGVFFAGDGVLSAVTGKTEVEISPVQVQGTNVQIAGLMLAIVGGSFIWSALRQK